MRLLIFFMQCCWQVALGKRCEFKNLFIYLVFPKPVEKHRQAPKATRSVCHNFKAPFLLKPFSLYSKSFFSAHTPPKLHSSSSFSLVVLRMSKLLSLFIFIMPVYPWVTRWQTPVITDVLMFTQFYWFKIFYFEQNDKKYFQTCHNHVFIHFPLWNL